MSSSRAVRGGARPPARPRARCAPPFLWSFPRSRHARRRGRPRTVRRAGFTHALASAYLLSMAALLVRVQTNVLGRNALVDMLRAGPSAGDASDGMASGAAPTLLQAAETAYMATLLQRLTQQVPNVVELVQRSLADQLATYVAALGRVTRIAPFFWWWWGGQVQTAHLSERSGCAVAVRARGVHQGCRCGARSRGPMSPPLSRRHVLPSKTPGTSSAGPALSRRARVLNTHRARRLG